MKRLLLSILSLLILGFSSVFAQGSNKVAMLVPTDYTASADEKAAVEWFNKTYVASGKGVILTPSTISSLSIDNNALCWVMCDREGINKGYGNLPGGLASSQTVSALKSFCAAGGNLLLTNHATQLTVALGRIAETYAPGIFGSGAGGQNNDVWGVQPIIGDVEGQIYDHSTHDIYTGLNFVSGLYARSIYPFEGSGIKGDHNSMWDLNAYGLAASPNVVKAWEDLTNSTVLGTWNHVVDYCCAGIVDFNPTTTLQGRILAVGLASYEWNLGGETNTYKGQLEKFTTNCINYLDKNYEPEPPVVSDFAARFDMSLSGNSVKELASGKSYSINSALSPFAVSALDGDALRFDGYSNYVKAGLPTASLSSDALTINVLLAAETYPMMNVAEAENTPTYATACGNLNESEISGMALKLSSQGDLRFSFGSTSNYVLTIQGNKKLECGKWNMVTVVLDKANNTGVMYLNGEQIGTCRMSRAGVKHSTADFYIGKDASEKKTDVFLINTFCGLIDDITIYNKVLTAGEVVALMPSGMNTSRPDFAYPASRYAESLWRPQFHGMPSGGWTNECHGLTYSDGKYHVFFQKNANGPYMARLHWGHISSENLYKWKEEPIALYPEASYDIKGCWSGCVFTDDAFTGGKPNIIYTAVDNAKATIALAKPNADDLIGWAKADANPIINGRPQGLSDDFRDPYFFSANGNKYIIVGTSKNGIGACTLHKYQNGSWTNDGKIFFKGSNANQHGTFWEMPNVTDMGNGKWLFTCTPLGLGTGVRTIYWVGTIAADGTFTPDNDAPESLEMGGIGKDGYGLLSPSIYQKDGKTLLLGIVPDKLPGNVNYRMGWAHNYSLPREIALGSDGKLTQKPYSGLTAMRTSTKVEKQITVNGEESLAPVSGRQIELLGEFTVGTGNVGFNFLKTGSEKASLTYNVNLGTLTLDITALTRQVNDGVYGGIYTVTLPEKVNTGGKLKLHVYLDGSIADIFVNDKWAYSVRLFPNNAAAVEAEVFATASAEANVKAWILNPEQNIEDGIVDIPWNDAHVQASGTSAIYDLQGRKLNGKPQKGLYIKDGKKYYAD